ncbi:MAG: CPBP family intramembrane glutamic endopeptidase [Bacillota bacterium]
MNENVFLAEKRPFISSLLITIFLLFILFLAGMFSVVGNIDSRLTFFIGFLILSLMLIIFISKNNNWVYYGFSSYKKINMDNKHIYIPLLILAFMPLFTGISSDLTLRKILYLMSYMALVAFVEEIIFRGIILKILLKKGLMKAIFGSSILFSLSHLLNTLQVNNLFSIMSQTIYALIIGIILAMIVIKTNNIIIAIVFHYLNNIMTSLNPGVESLLSSLISAIMFIIAIIYIIYLYSLDFSKEISA